MRVLLPSLVLSVFALCCTTAKVYVVVYRAYRKEKIDLAEALTAWVLWLLCVLLLVFSILQIEIAVDILLSLANGALIIYQYVWVWQFLVCQAPRQLVVGTQVSCIITICILLSVLPSVVKEHYKAWHIASLSFFALEYVLLEIIYGCMFWADYRESGISPIRKLLLWNMYFSLIAFLAAIPSIFIYTKGLATFDESLWIKYAAAGIWFLRWILLQLVPSSNPDAD